MEYSLNNGIKIPAIGFGTYRLPDTEEGAEAVSRAIECGYRLIDGAAIYANERSVGEGIRYGGVAREDLFITSKVWNSDRGYDSTLRAFEKSLNDLDLSYLDLYLIHWPATPERTPSWKEENGATWLAMERLYREGAVKAIGVSNFGKVHLDGLMEKAEITPMVDQIEFNPGCTQAETVGWCRAHNVIPEAWSPLGRGRILDNPLLLKIAERHEKSAAQIALRWEVQKMVIPLPKSLNPDRMRENIDIFDFTLSPEEMKEIDSLAPFGASGLTPANIDK